MTSVADEYLAAFDGDALSVFERLQLTGNHLIECSACIHAHGLLELGDNPTATMDFLRLCIHRDGNNWAGLRLPSDLAGSVLYGSHTPLISQA